MSKIKICGLRRPEDIEYVNACKPDYIGFIFFPKSKRYVEPEYAKLLGQKLDKEITKVGVFVNEKPETVADILNQGIIDVAQLHGDEDDTYIEALRKLAPDKKVIKAVRVQSAEDLKECEKIPADYILFDKFTPAYGGCGESFDWNLVTEVTRPFFLAGGLKEDNILEAIEKLHPFAVDLSSAVEGEDGFKDRDKVLRIVELVKGNRQ